MCRLALFDNKGLKVIEKTYGIKEYFDYLEHSQGGHGNGVALIKDSKCILLEKGLSLSNATIEKIIKNNTWDWCIYHTRIASIGSKKSRNCHPFKCDDNVLAMNGTETDFEFIADIQDITDTESILRFATLENVDLVDITSQLSSVFIGLHEGEVFVTAGKTASFKFDIVKEDGGVIFASEFPSEFNTMKPLSFPFIWREGDELYLTKARDTAYRYSYGYSNWDEVDNDNSYIDNGEELEPLNANRHGWERYFDEDTLEKLESQSVEEYAKKQKQKETKLNKSKAKTKEGDSTK